MAPTNRLTNGSFDLGATGWTTDDPVTDGTRTYTFASGALMTDGTGTGSIAQQINVTAGEELWVTLRGCASSSGMALAVGVYNGATYRYATDGAHVAPLDWEWPIRSKWMGWRIVVPTGWTTAKVFVKFPSGTVWLQEIGCYTSTDLVLDGDFSTNTDGTTGGDGATPEGWTYDYRLVSGAGSGWGTYGGALRHTNTSNSFAACQAFAVTAGERLFVRARSWGAADESLIRLYWGTLSTFTYAQATGEDSINGTSATASEQWEITTTDGWATVPAATTYARIGIGSDATNGIYWDSVSVRRCSTIGEPDVRVELNLGGLSGSLERPGYDGNWIVGDTGDFNVVGTSFLSTWEGGDFSGLAWTDITEFTHSVSISRGRRSQTDTYETGSCRLELDNSDRRFDPLWTHADNPYARAGVSYVRAGRPVRVSLCDPANGEPYPIFTGRTRRLAPGFDYPAHGWCWIDAAEEYTQLNVPIAETTFATSNSTTLLGALLDAVGWPETMRAIDTTALTTPEITVSGSMLGHIRGCALRAFGRLFLDGAGRVRMRLSQYRTSTEQATIDPNSTVGDGNGLDPESLRLEYDDVMIRNRVKAIRYGGTEADSQVSTDEASRDEYGTSSYEVTDLLVVTNANAKTWTDTILAANKSPVARVDSVTIAPHVNAGWWSMLMWAEFGDRFAARAYPPPYGSTTVEQSVALERVEWEIRPLQAGGWRVVWSFVPYAVLSY